MAKLNFHQQKRQKTLDQMGTKWTGIPVISIQSQRVQGIKKDILNIDDYVDKDYEVTGKVGMIFTIRKSSGGIIEG